MRKVGIGYSTVQFGSGLTIQGMYPIRTLDLSVLVFPRVIRHRNKIALFARDEFDTMNGELIVQGHIEDSFDFAGVEGFDQLCFDILRYSSFP